LRQKREHHRDPHHPDDRVPDPGRVHDEIRLAADHRRPGRAREEDRRRPERRRQGQGRSGRRQQARRAQLSAARDDAAKRLADAERLAQQMVEEAKGRASEEGAKIVAAAAPKPSRKSVKAREVLREQVAALAVKGAEQILRARSTPVCTPSCWAA
jgi:PAB1-binding protein PBP1